MTDRTRIYRVQILDGYIDGKPSWRMVDSRSRFSKEESQEIIDGLLRLHPDRKYRIRSFKNYGAV